MKQITIALVILLTCSVSVNADLNLIGQGSSVHGTYNLIYDTDLDITWYDYSTSYDSWQNQMDWTNGLSVNFGANTYADWRLPIKFDECYGANCTNSELGHLYYTELGNIARGPLGNSGDFQNLVSTGYWTGTDYSANPDSAWLFYANLGIYNVSTKNGTQYAIAVRDGLVTVVPEPISSTLFIVGGVTLGFRRFRKQFKK